MDDVVAELDDWLAREATTLKHYPNDDTDTGVLQRARDEIVALRGFRAECERQFQAQVAEVGRLLDHVTCPQVRAEALEEAARIADRWHADVAAAIRELKDAA